MQKPQVVAHFLVPADQHAPEAIHPTMRPLHDPPSCLEAGLLFERLGLFPPRADVGGEAKFGQQIPHLIIVIAFVQTHPLWGVWGGSGRAMGILAMVSRAILKSLRFAPSTARPTGTPPPSVSTLRLVPILPGRGFFRLPPQGALWSWPIHREPFPVNPL